jgi:hypothetical protein
MEIKDNELRAMAQILKALSLCNFSWEVRLRVLRWAVERNCGTQYQIIKKDS